MAISVQECPLPPPPRTEVASAGLMFWGGEKGPQLLGPAAAPAYKSDGAQPHNATSPAPRCHFQLGTICPGVHEPMRFHCNPTNKDSNCSEGGPGGWTGDFKVLLPLQGAVIKPQHARSRPGVSQKVARQKRGRLRLGRPCFFTFLTACGQSHTSGWPGRAWPSCL